MESSVGSSDNNKPWDHAWTTDEMRKNRRNWSLAGDSGLLKHLQAFSENLTKKANETQNVINSMASEIHETTILVDNIMNTSLALANTQFIESRVQEDNIEIEQPTKDIVKIEDDHEINETGLLVSVCESIKQGLSIMDEKYEKVEVIPSDSEDDDDDNATPSVILRAKDPYQNRPLPYVIGTEQWKISNKIGLESSSSESEQNDENEDSLSDIENKNVGNILNSNPCNKLEISRVSPTSSESNDYNIESSSIKDTLKNRLHAKSQDTLNSDTEPTTPSSVLPRTYNINNAPPSFAEELAKRLGNVLPSQKPAIVQNTNEQVINRSKDETFTSNDQNIFSNKSDAIFTEGKFNEVSSSSINTRSINPTNKNIIPSSIDVPPPLSKISSAPKSTIDDLFGDVDDSEDSDDIFSKKISRDIFFDERETIRSEVINKQKNLSIENIKNTSTITTSTPEISDKIKGLFKEEEEEEKQKKLDDKLCESDDKQIKSSNNYLVESTKKKPVGGVSVLGKVDLQSFNKFVRRSSTSSSESDSIDHRIISNIGETTSSKNKNNSYGGNISSFEAGNNVGNSQNIFSGNNTGSISGISVHQPSIDNTARSSLGTDFQPLMTSSRLKSEEIYCEHVASDSLFSCKSKSNPSNNQPHQHQSEVENVTGPQEIFGPPPLFKATDSYRPKSKVASLFDDSDSGDDLFINASPDTKSLKSIEHTPSKIQNEKKKSLFDYDNDLFGSKDSPNVDLFAAVPVKNLSKIADNLFGENKKPTTDSVLISEDFNKFMKNKTRSTLSSLFGETSNSAKVPKYSVNSLFCENLEDVKANSDNLFNQDNSNVTQNLDAENKILSQSVDNLTKKSTSEKASEQKKSNTLFKDSEDFLDSNLFSKDSKLKSTTFEKDNSLLRDPKNIFQDDPDSDLFESSANSILEKNIVGHSSKNLLDALEESTNIFENKSTNKFDQKTGKESSKNILEDTLGIAKSRKLTSIFNDSDEDDQDLFSGFNFSKKVNNKKSSNIFEDKISINIERNMESKKKGKEENLDVREKGEKSKKKENKDKKVDEAVSSKLITKSLKKNKVFDDIDDDDDDLFGSNKKTYEKEKINKNENENTKKKLHDVNHDNETQLKSETHITLDSPSKKFVLTEIKEKLEKHKMEHAENNTKSETSAIDGTVSSKKTPPKSLEIQSTASTFDESSVNQQALKKPAMSGKIKNLMGKINDLKILSPTDTPPQWRKKNIEKNGNDNEQDVAADVGNSEASSPSFPSTESSPRASGTNSRAKDSLSSKSDNTEVAISFDEPAQIETLTSTASKSRVRIQSKRRPQSRYARQSALRHSGIDFDIVDTSESGSFADVSSTDFDANSTGDRLLPSKTSRNSDNSRNIPLDTSQVDDKSELSISRNTATNLLSPSTDEEDLFDVPPDLPEDPLTKEDSLFGRAPILSPVTNLEAPQTKVKLIENEKIDNKCKENLKEKNSFLDENKADQIHSIDPLRDNSHDPLKDPSQLFAFVTKTPSPDKNKGLLSNKDDDSLFSNSSKPLQKTVDSKSKSTLDLFFDDDDTAGSDIFSSNKRHIKKSLKDSNINILKDVSLDDEDNGLFGSVVKKHHTTKNQNNLPTLSGIKKVNYNTVTKNTKVVARDIFNSSSDDDDIFTNSKKPLKKKTIQSPFENDGDNSDDDIFGKPKLSMKKDIITDKEKVIEKKALTKDLKKTAKKIVEDPLSVLQND